MTVIPNNQISNKSKLNPRVTVLVNCYNGAKTIGRCIRSALNQTFQDFEVLVWDNVSTDASADIVHSFANLKIRYIKAPLHTSLYEARNLALKEVRGELVSILDVDDWWVHDKLERQIAFFEDKKVGLVYGNFFEVDYAKKKTTLKYARKLPEGDIANDLLSQYCVGSLTIIFKRSSALANKIDFNPYYNIIGDFDFVFRLARVVEARALDEPLAYASWGLDNLSLRRKHDHLLELDHWLTDNASDLSKYMKPELTKFVQKIELSKLRQEALLRQVTSICSSPLLLMAFFRSLKIKIEDKWLRYLALLSRLPIWLRYRLIEQFEFRYLCADPKTLTFPNFENLNLKVSTLNLHDFEAQKTQEFAELHEISELLVGNFNKYCVVFYIIDDCDRLLHYSIVYPDAAKSTLPTTPLPIDLYCKDTLFVSNIKTVEFARGGMLPIFVLSKIVCFARQKNKQMMVAYHPSTRGAGSYYKALGFKELFSQEEFPLAIKVRLIVLGGFAKLIGWEKKQSKRGE